MKEEEEGEIRVWSSLKWLKPNQTEPNGCGNREGEEVFQPVIEPASVTASWKQRQEKAASASASACLLEINDDDAVSAAETNFMVCGLRIDAVRVGSDFSSHGSHGFWSWMVLPAIGPAHFLLQNCNCFYSIPFFIFLTQCNFVLFDLIGSEFVSRMGVIVRRLISGNRNMRNTTMDAVTEDAILLVSFFFINPISWIYYFFFWVCWIGHFRHAWRFTDTIDNIITNLWQC